MVDLPHRLAAQGLTASPLRPSGHACPRPVGIRTGEAERRLRVAELLEQVGEDRARDMTADEVLLVTGDVCRMPVEALHLHDRGVDDHESSLALVLIEQLRELLRRHEVSSGRRASGEGEALRGSARGYGHGEIGHPSTLTPMPCVFPPVELCGAFAVHLRPRASSSVGRASDF